MIKIIPKTKHLKNISVPFCFDYHFYFFPPNHVFSSFSVCQSPYQSFLFYTQTRIAQKVSCYDSLYKKKKKKRLSFFNQMNLRCSGKDVHAVGCDREDQVYFISLISTEQAARVRSLIHLSTQKHLMPFEVLKSTPPSVQQQVLKVMISPQPCIISSGPLRMPQMHKLNYLESF